MKNKTIFISLLLLLLTPFLNATVYENGENGISKWSVYDTTPSGATISSVYDTDKNSSVIKLEGDATRNGYKLGHWSGELAWNNSDTKLSWSMKYSEDYFIFINVQTLKGQRYLYYSNRDSDRGLHDERYIHHGLGAETVDGTWHTVTRDLEVDLQEYEDNNSILSVNTFLVRGSGLLDDIALNNNTVQISNVYYTVEEVESYGEGANSDILIKKTNIYKHTGNTKVMIKTIFDNQSDYRASYELNTFNVKTIGNTTYFLVDSTNVMNHIYGVMVTHLWKTDGTEAGTVKLASFTSFYDSFLQKPKFTTYVAGKLNIEYSEEDLPSGDVWYDYWETDGTVAGTVKLRRVIK